MERQEHVLRWMELNESFAIGMGVRQGFVMLLFNVFMDGCMTNER